VARAARERKAVIVNDTKAAPDHLPNPLLPNTRSEMAVPMIVGDKLLGVLDVQSDQEDRFDERDIRLMEALGEQVSVAAQNAMLYQREVSTSHELRRVDLLKSEFLASMSHELRTPLNSIIGYAEVLIDGIDGDLPDEAQLDVQAIYDSGQHLLGLINQILDLAKIEAGHMELDLEEVDLEEVVGEVERITQVLVKDKEVALVFDIPKHVPHVLADHQRLRQILNNLVSNAIKFTDKGEVRITADLLDSGDLVKVQVRDTGMGIAPEHIGMIFEQFRQADNSSTRRFGGTGLGLPITQHLVQMHGGTIGVESTVGVGSVFSFTIPIMRVTIPN
jgi:signal transduction histidine kinase